ncbi:MAG: DUF2442 domain-containing protein [Melioribacteraceae bacterium]|nr:DUF2442 domain-containing protein [Melioribacteraceae bacterium]MCF8263518.1 DUF2442 domain-containing protein [Melioribacteraceae bacterium]MCF8411898.1 DUF2442 domain-containing protein [Melioribacteraceae bacterium]MCF8431830.1 DUF2442 domain-containing protein [Melioribacteraceae bacterium]
MNSPAEIIDAKVKTIEVDDSSITSNLEAGRPISIPSDWSWRLKSATEEQLNIYEIIGNVSGIY